MKKVLLSILTLFAGLSVQAQFENGYFSERGYAMDYVTDLQNVNKVYWWEQKTKDLKSDTSIFVRVDSLIDPLAALSKQCTTFMAPYVYKWVRVPQNGTDLTSGYVSYTMNQTYGNYEPVGVGFGEGNVLDINNGNAFLGFKFKNTSSKPIKLQVGLQDANKHIINSMAKKVGSAIKPVTSTGQIYTEQVEFVLAAGASVDTVLDFNPKRFDGYTPYYPEYKKDECFRSLENTPTFPNPVRIRLFDYTKLYAATFTVVSTTRKYDFEDSFKPNSIKNVTFQISKFRVGTQNGLGLNDEESNISNILSVYPNPVNNGLLNLNMVVQNIKVLDVLGNVVITSASAKEVNVSSLNKGVYTLQCSKGTSRFVVE